MDSNLLPLTRCPLTCAPLVVASDELLGELNLRIENGSLSTQGGTSLTEPFSAGVIDEAQTFFYPERNGIYLLIESEAVSLQEP